MRSIRPALPLEAAPVDTRLGAARGLLSGDRGNVSPVGVVLALAMLAAGGFLLAYMTLPETEGQAKPLPLRKASADVAVKLATEESR